MKEYDANSTMQGYVFIKSRKRKFAYVFEEGCLTVFSGNSIPISENEEIELNLHSNTDYVIANDLSTGKNILFFVERVPFGEDGPIIWTSTGIRVYFYIVLSAEIEKFNISKVCFSFKELNKFFPLNNGLKYEMHYDDRTVKL